MSAEQLFWLSVILLMVLGALAGAWWTRRTATRSPRPPVLIGRHRGPRKGGPRKVPRKKRGS